MGHLGLTPQAYHQFGGNKVQARTESAVERLVEDARALESAGAFAVVLEAVPNEAARRETEALTTMATIGIGAGPHCNGHVLVTTEMLASAPGRGRATRRCARTSAQPWSTPSDASWTRSRAERIRVAKSRAAGRSADPHLWRPRRPVPCRGQAPGQALAYSARSPARWRWCCRSWRCGRRRRGGGHLHGRHGHAVGRHRTPGRASGRSRVAWPYILLASTLAITLAVALRRPLAAIPFLAAGALLYWGMYLQPALPAIYVSIVLGLAAWLVISPWLLMPWRTARN